MNRTVCVTGAAGYMASHVVAQLLEKGYTVHGTVRSLKDEARLAHLHRLGAALPGQLRLVEADLLSPGSFDAAVQGCHCVVHTASPFQFGLPDSEASLMRPSVQGTEAVMQSVAKHKDTVDRVVLTSSVAAVHDEYQEPPSSGTLYTEADFNTTATIETRPYHLSKVAAEKRAMQLAAEIGVKLIALCPNFNLGPPLSDRADGTSVGYLKGILEGTEAPSGTPIIVDVRDVARAHVLASEQPLDRLQSRYIISHRSGLNPQDVSQWLSEAYPQAKIKPGESLDTPEKMNDSRQAELGLVLRQPKETLLDMAAVLIALGLVKV